MVFVCKQLKGEIISKNKSGDVKVQCITYSSYLPFDTQ